MVGVRNKLCADDCKDRTGHPWLRWHVRPTALLDVLQELLLLLVQPIGRYANLGRMQLVRICIIILTMHVTP